MYRSHSEEFSAYFYSKDSLIDTVKYSTLFFESRVPKDSSFFIPYIDASQSLEYLDKQFIWRLVQDPISSHWTRITF